MVTRILAAAALLLGATPGRVAGESPLGPLSTQDQLVAAARNTLIDRDLFSRRRTLQATSLHDLVRSTAPISRNAFVKYGPNWRQYLLASNMWNQRAGKTLEAVFAWRMNAQRARLGNPNRVRVTAAEGLPTHPADLVDVAPDERVLGWYQSKWGSNAARKALEDSKYDGMRILTTRESFTTIERDLLRAEAKAARRGLPLASKWQAVRDAIDQERLPRSWAGKPLPTARGIAKLVSQQTRREFQAAARAARWGCPWCKSPGKALGKAFVVVDLAGTTYWEYLDVQRYQSGEIGGGYLTFKSTLRASQLWLTWVAAGDPEPVTKLISATAAVALVAVDATSDAVYQRRQEAAAMILESVDRDERYHAARMQLLSLYGASS